MLKVPVGVTLEGVIAQVEGGGVAPVLQPKFTALLYPLIARTVPLNTAVCPANTVAVLFGIENSKSGAAVSANCQTPRPYVEARKILFPPELPIRSDV